MTAIVWFLLIGALLVLLAISGSFLKRIPLSTGVLYLLVGIGVGPLGMNLFYVDPVEQAALLERITELAVIVSLFAAGLKLRSPLSDYRWIIPFRLASISMAITVALVALVATLGMGLPLGAGVLLGAVLAPTDPVLAADVQVEDPADRDQLRFSLTGEAGLNDGTAFPFVMLGLGLLGLHEMGEGWWRWIAIDVVWAVFAGLAVGTLSGAAVGRLVIHLRQTHKEAVGLDDFLGLGLIAFSYGAALLIHSYGFLAVFAAGLALRRIERNATGGHRPPPEVVAAGESEEKATDAEAAPAYMAQAVLGFSEQLERILTVAVVVLLGGMLSQSYVSERALWFVPLLILVIRPVAAWAGLLGTRADAPQRRMIAWFGVRGVGSVYYLTFAINHGVPPELAEPLTALMLATIVTSIVLHGVTVTPLMKRTNGLAGRNGPSWHHRALTRIYA